MSPAVGVGGVTSLTPRAPEEAAEHPAGLTITTSPAAKGSTSSTPPLALPPSPAHRIRQSAAAWERAEPAKFPSRPGAERTGSRSAGPELGRKKLSLRAVQRHILICRGERPCRGESTWLLVNPRSSRVRALESSFLKKSSQVRTSVPGHLS